MNGKMLMCAALLAAAFAADAAPKAAKPAPSKIQSEQDKALKLLKRADNLYQQQRYAEAVKLYRQGAEQYPSLPLFDMRLGEMYLFGKGVDKNSVKAHQHLKQAHLSSFHYYQFTYYDANFLFLFGKASIEGAGDFAIHGIVNKLKAALYGHQTAYAELPDDLRLAYAEHTRIPDPNGQTIWRDNFLIDTENESAEYRKQRSSWRFLMIDVPNLQLDNPRSASLPAMQLSIAYEHGIGVPKNRIAAQALRLYARETWRQHGDQRREVHFWLLNDLSAAEQAEAENLAQRLLALSRGQGDGLVPTSSAVLDEVRKYAGQTPQ